MRKIFFLAILLFTLLNPDAQAVWYRFEPLSRQELQKLSNRELFDLYIQVKIESEANKAFFNESGFQKKDYIRYKKLLGYLTDLDLEISRRGSAAAPDVLLVSSSSADMESSIRKAYLTLTGEKLFPEEIFSEDEYVTTSAPEEKVDESLDHYFESGQTAKDRDQNSYSYHYHLESNQYQHKLKHGYSPYYFSDSARSRYSYSPSEKGHYILGKTDKVWPFKNSK